MLKANGEIKERKERKQREPKRSEAKLNRITLTLSITNKEIITNIIRDIKECFNDKKQMPEKVIKSIVEYSPDNTKTYILMNLMNTLETEEDFIKIIKILNTILIIIYGIEDFSYTYKTNQKETNDPYNILYRFTTNKEQKKTIKTKDGFIIDD